LRSWIEKPLRGLLSSALLAQWRGVWGAPAVNCAFVGAPAQSGTRGGPAPNREFRDADAHPGIDDKESAPVARWGLFPPNRPNAEHRRVFGGGSFSNAAGPGPSLTLCGPYRTMVNPPALGRGQAALLRKSSGCHFQRRSSAS
jgi:hypothetical protein